MFIIISYLILCYTRQINKVPIADILNVVINLTMLEWYYNWSIESLCEPFHVMQLVYFPMDFIIQDVYFYIVHRVMHKWFYRLHSVHHEHYEPFYALYMHHVDFIVLILGSIFVPMILLPICYEMLVIFGIIEVWRVVQSHTDSAHYLHHKYPDKMFGLLYIPDYLFGTYITEDAI